MRQLELLEPFNVLAVGHYAFGGGVLWANKLVGQVTKCRSRDGVTFYVRENCNGTPSFLMNAGQRWGDKTEKVGDARQTLELCAPAEQWKLLSAMVREADPFQRPVMKNKRFTAAVAEACLNNGEFGGNANCN